MLNRATKAAIYVLLQVTLLITPMSVAAETSALEARMMEPIQIEKSGSFQLSHAASTSMNVSVDNAPDASVEACMSLALSVLGSLPAEHAEALTDLTLVFDDNAKRGQAGGHLMRIRCVDISDEEFAAVMVHEMGHIVDTGLLQGSGSDEYVFSDGSKPVLKDDLSVLFYETSWISNYSFTSETDGYSFVSRYATSDPFEDFAETYVAYVLHGETFRSYAASSDEINEKYEFMKNYVFEGIEYSGIDQAQAYDERVYDVTKLPFDLDFFLNN
ncbi:hypothetical protein COW94_02055 [Candidatus Peregrinibacteria bacterium CG22_combo_CG10-13_8_21_14_all_44_10]|nr:MAG: hypothetical protein COW94_02055 [Candidatus Peregrinibacteria bacterium CG22_combo_CG10-13_8_21_14_all_44_10]PJB88445.1 MAG: hypothetical protein CO082_04400 [Candidatus Peregrinibacteria bacterium CG_4_9_14_0_8_um_filter_44_15]